MVLEVLITEYCYPETALASEHSELRFGIICDLYDVGAGIETTLSDDEYVVDFIFARSEAQSSSLLEMGNFMHVQFLEH